MNRSQLIKSVFKFFLESQDFNGYPVYHLLDSENKLNQKPIQIISEVIKSGDCTLVTNQTNPHIKSLEDSPIEDQLQALKTRSINSMCIYPSYKYLKNNRDVSEFEDKPFSLELALGAPQLRSRFFELHVLDRYISDPRYDFNPIDYSGSIYFSEENVDINNRDHIYLKSFGVAYDKNKRRVISVFLRDLHRLNAEQQQYWRIHLLNSECKLNGDYFRNSFLGQWAKYISIYAAIIEEMHAINELSHLMDKSHLFREDFKNNRPKRFGLIIRPTTDHFNTFISILDKMLSENINQNFFSEDGIIMEEEILRDDDRIEIRSIGTLRLMEQWFKMFYKPSDDSIYDDIFPPLKKVRKLRQTPAHKLSQDEFDYYLFNKQEDILNEVHKALYMIRLCFQNHPNAKEYAMPNWYDVNKITHY